MLTSDVQLRAIVLTVVVTFFQAALPTLMQPLLLIHHQLAFNRPAFSSSASGEASPLTPNSKPSGNNLDLRRPTDAAAATATNGCLGTRLSVYAHAYPEPQSLVACPLFSLSLSNSF